MELIGTVSDALQGTPVWVYAVLVALVLLGLDALRTRVRSPMRLAVSALGLAGAGVPTDADAGGLLIWASVLAVSGAVVATRVLRLPLTHDRSKGRLVVPGSAAPLFLMLSVFTVRYAAGYYAAVHGITSPGVWVTAATSCISGACVGASLGRAGGLLMQYAFLSRGAPPA